MPDDKYHYVKLDESEWTRVKELSETLTRLLGVKLSAKDTLLYALKQLELRKGVKHES